MSDYTYEGTELGLFQHAVRWKRYYASHLTPHIAGDVLEVGAGIGGTARFLCTSRPRSWTCLEPDARLAAQLRDTLARDPLPVPARAVTGTLSDLPAEERFDTILYIDVLEHIEDDHAELARAAERLREGGCLIVLAPAHHWLFSPFDTAVGHFRRYNRRTLLAAAPPDLPVVRAWYLDAIGMLASAANRILLKASQPTQAQIAFWDSTLVPPSRVVDPLTGYRVGKTVLAVWRRGRAAP